MSKTRWDFRIFAFTLQHFYVSTFLICEKRKCSTLYEVKNFWPSDESEHAAMAKLNVILKDAIRIWNKWKDSKIKTLAAFSRHGSWARKPAGSFKEQSSHLSNQSSHLSKGMRNKDSSSWKVYWKMSMLEETRFGKLTKNESFFFSRWWGFILQSYVMSVQYSGALVVRWKIFSAVGDTIIAVGRHLWVLWRMRNSVRVTSWLSYIRHISLHPTEYLPRQSWCYSTVLHIRSRTQRCPPKAIMVSPPYWIPTTLTTNYRNDFGENNRFSSKGIWDFSHSEPPRLSLQKLRFQNSTPLGVRQIFLFTVRY